jgi:hypothetical protein
VSPAAILSLQRPLATRLRQLTPTCDKSRELRIAARKAVRDGLRQARLSLRAIGSRLVAETDESKLSYHGLRLSLPTGRRKRCPT